MFCVNVSVIFGGPFLSVKEKERKKIKLISGYVKRYSKLLNKYKVTDTLLEVEVCDFTKIEMFHKSFLRILP